MRMKAPEQQAILKGGAQEEEGPSPLAAATAQLAVKEALLQTLSDNLTAMEEALLRQGNSNVAGQPAAAAGLGGPAGDDGSNAVMAARWRGVAERRAELVARWQCLLEEKRQLGLALQQGKRGELG